MMLPVIIDTNLLILLVVGLTRRDLISKHARSRVYTDRDFDLLMDLIVDLRRIMLIPNVLTETSNLISDYGEPDRSNIRRTLKSIIEMYREEYVVSRYASSLNHFVRLGLTDAAITAAALRPCHILTDDFDLYIASDKMGLPYTYFLHERMNAGLVETS